MCFEIVRNVGGALALVVEDDPSCAATFERALRRHAIEVRVVDAADAVERVVGHDEWGRVCGALVDVSLPGGCGTDVAAMVLERNPHACVALVSGIVKIDDLRSTMAALSVPVLSKPIALADLDRWATTVATRSDAIALARTIAELEVDLRADDSRSGCPSRRPPPRCARRSEGHCERSLDCCSDRADAREEPRAEDARHHAA